MAGQAAFFPFWAQSGATPSGSDSGHFSAELRPGTFPIASCCCTRRILPADRNWPSSISSKSVTFAWRDGSYQLIDCLPTWRIIPSSEALTNEPELIAIRHNNALCCAFLKLEKIKCCQASSSAPLTNQRGSCCLLQPDRAKNCLHFGYKNKLHRALKCSSPFQRRALMLVPFPRYLKVNLEASPSPRWSVHAFRTGVCAGRSCCKHWRTTRSELC